MMGILTPLRIGWRYFADVVLAAHARHLAGIGAWERYGTFVLLLSLVSAGLFMLAAWRLWRRHEWRSVRFAIMVMWVASFGMEIYVVVMLQLMFGMDAVLEVLERSRFEMVRGLLFPVLWTLYLLRSERVRNTYRRPTPLEELARGLGMRRKR